ncbi:MAG TPA: hypothetical protein PKE29_04860 [Phycisphaerales bacterium]|nr:hypothetical protein [Phycisphaerales bacterium]
MPANKCIVLCLVIFMAHLAGCKTSIPKSALAMSEVTLQQRQLQTRRFDTADEKKILVASAGLLQDLGYNMESSQTDVGLIVGAKDREAVEGGQVIGKFLVAALVGANVPIDKHQKIRASIVTRPTNAGIAVRVTFQRVVWNDAGQVSRLQFMDDPKMYQEFFGKLSKAVFLEAQSI